MADAAGGAASGSVLPIEEVARLPLPGMAMATAAAFSPDGRLVTFLHSPERSLERRLHALDLDSGERTVLLSPPGGGVQEGDLPIEERLRRERARELGLGVTRYAWAKARARVLVPLSDGLYVQDVGAEARLAVPTGDGPPILDPKLSPDGETVGFVRDGELWVAPVDGSGPPRQLTDGGAAIGRVRGLAEFVAQEEMGRASGWWWSDDGRWIALCEVDETHIPVYRIVHQGSDAVGEGAQEDHRYPFAGAANASVRLGVVPAAGGDIRWLDLGGDGEYLARVDWAPDGTLLAQVEDRAQSQLVLRRFNPSTGARSLVLREASDVWINLHDGLRQLADGRILWLSERTGYRHVILDGRAITSGDWQVDAVEGVDEDAGLVYVSGTLDTPVERHLYAVPIDGGEPRRLTPDAGTHSVVVDTRSRRFVDTWSSLTSPPRVEVRALDDGALITVLDANDDPRVAQLALRPPEPVSIVNRDGVTLFGAFYRPATGSPPWPTVVWVYGGPHAQLVTNSWSPTVALRAQHLRSRGFAVFVLDNRGSARRGLAFEGAVRHDLGNLEVADQVDGVRWLVGQGVTDPARVGIYGWSYGGYMAAMCLARAPDTFAAAVAGAPVTSWDGYDTHYTERYMGTPQDNPDGYRLSRVMSWVDGIRGRLLLVHGLIDENVHFRHTARLVNALVASRTPYELLLFPDERHVPRQERDRVFMEERIVDFFERTLR